MSLIKRGEAAQAAADKFLHKEFSWGERDCVHLIASVLVALGHPNPLEGVGRYSTLLGARRAMRKAGVETLEGALDARFERIAPAMALPGDVIAVPSDTKGMPALGVMLSGGHFMAFAPLRNGRVIAARSNVLSICIAAWRVPPVVGEAV